MYTPCGIRTHYHLSLRRGIFYPIKLMGRYYTSRAGLEPTLDWLEASCIIQLCYPDKFNRLLGVNHSSIVVINYYSSVVPSEITSTVSVDSSCLLLFSNSCAILPVNNEFKPNPVSPDALRNCDIVCCIPLIKSVPSPP